MATFAEANVQYALDKNLSGWDLTGEDCRFAKWQGVNLRNAVLNGVNLKHANLRFANLKGVSVIDCDLQGADLRNTRFAGLRTSP